MVSTKALGVDIEYPLQSNALSAKSILGSRVALTALVKRSQPQQGRRVSQSQVQVIRSQIIGIDSFPTTYMKFSHKDIGFPKFPHKGLGFPHKV